MASKRKMKMKRCMVEDTNNQLIESHSIRIIIKIYKLSINTISFCEFWRFNQQFSNSILPKILQRVFWVLKLV